MSPTSRGEVSCIGTATGTRLVIGRWAPGTVVLIEFVDGHRVVLASDAATARLLVDPSTVAETRVHEVAYEEYDAVVSVSAGDLAVTFRRGGPTPLGRGLALLPSSVPSVLARAVSRIAVGVGAPGHRVVGQASIASVSATWKGDELGELVDLVPAVEFALGSTPTSSSTMDVSTRRPYKPGRKR